MHNRNVMLRKANYSMSMQINKSEESKVIAKDTDAISHDETSYKVHSNNSPDDLSIN